MSSTADEATSGAAAAAEKPESADHPSTTSTVLPIRLSSLFVDAAAADDNDDALRPISERWSPLGANYDDNHMHMSDMLAGSSPLAGQPYAMDGECLGMVDADSRDADGNSDSESVIVDLTRLRTMEEEQELLTSSLMALTSHFAHVQFRVRQIVEAPSNERDGLLKDLEEFAFRGIPEVESIDPLCMSDPTDDDDETTVQTTRQRQCELIDRLKCQLTELEKFAYESGAPVLPQSVLLEKQKIIIDELKTKLNLNVTYSDLPQLSTEDLKNHVDTAIGEFVGPLKMKDQLVAQLKTQIVDLERFIAFLQCDSEENKLQSLDGADRKMPEADAMAYNSYSAKMKANAIGREDASSKSAKAGEKRKTTVSARPNADVKENARCSGESLNSKAHSLIDKAATLLQMFAMAQFGCKSNRFQKNTLKKTAKGNHWGDTRAQLEVDIQEIASLAATLQRDREKLMALKKSIKKSKSKASIDSTPTSSPAISQHQYASDLSSDSDSDGINDFYRLGKFRDRLKRSVGTTSHANASDSITLLNLELTTAVRKNFAVTLQKLIQHGLRADNESATSSLIVPFMGCLNPSALRETTRSDYNQAYPHGSQMGTDAPGVTSTPPTKNFHNTDQTQVETSDDADVPFNPTIEGRQMHAWELILEYYNSKHGDEYNDTPARKLSQSFNLDIVGARAVSNKQSLLSTIGTIKAIHSPYKRSYNSLFKAFICAGLNSHKLVVWLNLIFSSSDLINTYYSSWSYVACTGCRDALRSIDCLTKYDFDLPVDLAIRQFQTIKDVFM